jgi:hypothetical protein
LLKRVWDGVTSAAGSDARKRDDGDAKASSRSDETFERALDAPDGSGEWFSAFAAMPMMGLGSRDSRPPFAKRTPAAESPGHDARIHFSAACSD